MKNTKGIILRHLRLARRLFRSFVIPQKSMHELVSYFSQWESQELNKQIIEKKITARDDPQWKASGAKTKKEYEQWSWTGCGMACTKMILAHRTGKIVPLVTLGKKCAEYGGYTLPLETSIGLLYKPYTAFVKKEFGWRARVVQGMTLHELMHELGKGNDVIAGVSPLIRNPKSTPQVKGGHLVLMTGYDTIKQEFYLHNPSGISKDTQEYAAVSFNDFKKFFSGRGIVLER